MHDGEAQPSAADEDPGGLPNRTRHVVDVLERHERDREVGTGVGRGQRRRVGDGDTLCYLSLGRETSQGRRTVEPDDAVASLFQRAPDAPLTAADVDGEPAGWRNDSRKDGRLRRQK
jgi:hypothetical protein